MAFFAKVKSLARKFNDGLERSLDKISGPTEAQRADMKIWQDAATSGDVEALNRYFSPAFPDLSQSNLATKAFLIATRAGQTKAVEFFLARGASPTKGEYVTNETPLAVAKEKGYTDILALFAPYVKAEPAAAPAPEEITEEDVAEKIAGFFGGLSPRYKAYHEAQKAQEKAAPAPKCRPVI